MIVLMEYLDAISHPKKFDLLYVDFKCALHEKSACSAWQDLPSRWQLISWAAERCVRMEAAVFVTNDIDLITPP